MDLGALDWLWMGLGSVWSGLQTFLSTGHYTPPNPIHLSRLQAQQTEEQAHHDLHPGAGHTEDQHSAEENFPQALKHLIIPQVRVNFIGAFSLPAACRHSQNGKVSFPKREWSLSKVG